MEGRNLKMLDWTRSNGKGQVRLTVGLVSLKLKFIKARLLHKLKRAFVALVLATFTQQQNFLAE